MPERCDSLVIGGGFYGLYLSEHLARHGHQVRLHEGGPALMRRASYVNQARVHNGYHYPRSILTALRSRVNFPRFVDEFRGCIDESFEKIYAVARRGSKVSAGQFRKFMDRIGAPIRRAEPSVRRLFNGDLIEDVFIAKECAFDAVRLAADMKARAEKAGVRISLNSEAIRVQSGATSDVEVDFSNGCVTANRVLLCGYAQTNAVLIPSGLAPIPLKHEFTELALMQPPDDLLGLGVTVMDGPFFSCMPFPARSTYTLSHVRYTPHFHWYDGGALHQPAYAICAQAIRETAFPAMVRDAARYVPALQASKYRESLWEVKTVLPRSEADDSRPILFRAHHGIRNLYVVMGGKLDNVYDVVEALDAELAAR